MDNSKIGFIGLGNVGGKLAGSLARHGMDLTVRDLNPQLEAEFVQRGAARAAFPREMAERVDVIVTCLPSPAASAAVMERPDGVLAGLRPGQVWLEMSTTDAAEFTRLAALAEALTVCKVAGLDMNTAYEAIRISSGNSFVHETESQVILNGSRDISFTMDLVIKDVGLFDALAQSLDVPVELSPLVLNIFRDGQRRYGPRELSPNIIKRLEQACDVQVLGRGFPAQMVDDEPEAPGYEVRPRS